MIITLGEWLPDLLIVCKTMARRTVLGARDGGCVARDVARESFFKQACVNFVNHNLLNNLTVSFAQ